MKWLIRIVIIVVLLLIIVPVAALLMVDSIATTAVREGAAFATQTDVECDAVDVKIFGSSADIIKLDLKNPDGPFRDVFDSFLVVGNGSAQITVASVMSDLIEIPKVELSDIEITLVGLDDGTKNYDAILKSLKRFQGDDPPVEAMGQKKIIIRELIIRNITVKYDFKKDPALGAVPVSGTIVIADKEPIIMTDVGSDGVPISQITADIITDVLVQVTANMAGDLGGHMKGLAGSLIENIGEVKFSETLDKLDLSEKLDSLSNLGIDLGKGVRGVINKIPGLGDSDEKDKKQGD